MAQVFENFGSQTTGVGTPAGWTRRNDGTSAWTLTIVEDGAADGGKYLRYTAAGGDEVEFLVHTATGDATGPCEIVTKWRVKATEVVTGNFIPICVMFANGANLATYTLAWIGGSTHFRIARLNTSGGLTANLGSATPFTPTPGTWYGARFQRDGSNVMRGRVWDWGSAEPGTWDITTAADTNITTGTLGIGQEVNTSECEFDLIGIGTAGDPAPTSEPATGVEGDLDATEGADTAAIAGEVDEAQPPPSITDVDEDNTITSTQTNIEIDGADFSSAAVEIRQGSVEIAQSIDAQDVDTITFDAVFDAGGGPHLKYGAATLAVINDDDQEDTIAITIDAPSGVSFIDLDEPNTTADNRITAAPDLEEGDQLEISNVVGGDIDDVTVNTDATFECEEGVTSFDVRVWDVSDATWSAIATQNIGNSGDIGAVEGFDVSGISGQVLVQGDLAVTDAADVAAISGVVLVQGDLSATEAADIAAISGESEIAGVEGDLAVTEAADSAAIIGEVLVQGDLDAGEQSDVAAIAGEVDVTGDLSATEGADVAGIEGSVPAQGDLSVTEGASDTAAASGQVIVQGDLGATEGQDVAALNGTNDIIGTMAATEAADEGSAAGGVLVQGQLAAVEARDQAAASGEVDVQGDLSVSEASDSADVEGEVEQPLAAIVGSMAAADSRDTASILGLLERLGILAATEGRDGADIDGEIAQITGDPLPRANLPYATREAQRFGVSSGPYRNVVRRTVSTKNGTAEVTFVENVETSEPHSVVPGQD